MSWAPFPLLRVVILFVLGIVLAVRCDFIINPPDSYYLIGIAAGIYVVVYCFPFGKNTKGILGCILLMLLGVIHVSVKNASLQPSHVVNAGSIEGYDIVIDSYSEEKNSTWKTTGYVRQIHTKEGEKSFNGKIILYFSKKNFDTSFNYGQILHVTGSPRTIQPPSNPGEFDYKQFLAYKSIYHQHYIAHPDSVTALGVEPPSIFLQYSIRVRYWAQDVLKQFVPGEKECAIIQALVLGVKDGLDDELTQSYAASGAMHVLAVSGLHVGIIYMLIMAILRPLDRSRRGKWVVALIVIIFLWSYAFVTGLSPSVMRSVTMFSFVAFSKPLNRSTNIFNILAAAAFLMLLWDPYLLMAVGFQLSFLAVLGIVYFHPRIYRSWTPKSDILDRIWQLTSVSTAAQIATFPLSLYYFHQFPVYFMIANLFVIPAAFLVLVGGLLTIATSFSELLASFVGMCVSKVIAILNYLIGLVEQLPGSLVQSIKIESIATWLLYLMIIVASGFFVNKRFSWFVSLVAVASLFSFLQWQTLMTRRDAFVVYNIPSHTVIEFFSDTRSRLIADTVAIIDNDVARYKLSPARLQRGLSPEASLSESMTDFNSSVIKWHDKTIMILSVRPTGSFSPVTVDYLIICNNALNNFELPEGIIAKTLILDSSNTHYFASRTLKMAASNNIPAYSVRHDGAFELEL